jgi:predicted metal-dependent HD superfamily phosphohydrolase
MFTGLSHSFYLQTPKLISDLKELIEAALINSTPVHLTPNAVGTDDVHYILDIEMAVLGSSRNEYADTLVMMRDEYGFTSDSDYFELRLKVLRTSFFDFSVRSGVYLLM